MTSSWRIGVDSSRNLCRNLCQKNTLAKGLFLSNARSNDPRRGQYRRPLFRFQWHSLATSFVHVFQWARAKFVNLDSSLLVIVSVCAQAFGLRRTLVVAVMP